MDVDEHGGDPDENAESDEEEILDWCAYVNKFDVCITTYTVLQHALGRRTPATVPPAPRLRAVQHCVALAQPARDV